MIIKHSVFNFMNVKLLLKKARVIKLKYCTAFYLSKMNLYKN